MTPDDITSQDPEAIPEIVEELPPAEYETETASMIARRHFEGPALDASFSAIARADTNELAATASAVAFARVNGTAEARFSQVSMAYVTGDIHVNQCYTSAFVAGNKVAVHQGLVPLAAARKIKFDQAANCVSVAGNVKVKRSFVGLLLAGKSEVSEDSKILLTGRGLLIIAAAVLGGFGLVALAIMFGANRMSQWQPSISLPSWQELRRRFE